MASSSAAVTAGRFSYDQNGLTVDGFPRCDAATLRSHLKFVEGDPLRTKTGQPRKRLPRPDQPTEFYVAQLIHYGLSPPSAAISRDQAKSMLRDQDNLTGLIIAKEVDALEGRLRKKWEDAQTKARKAALKLPVDAAATSSTRAAGKRKRESNDTAPPVAVSKGAGPSANASPKKARVEATGRPAHGAAAGGTKSTSKAKSGVAQAPVEPKLEKPVKKAAEPLDLDAIAGYYYITAPSITREWPLPPKGVIKFALAPSPGRSHLWGDFDFGPVEGHLRSATTLSPANRIVRFLWRGRETGEGMMRFGKECTFSITFQADGAIKGTFSWLGKHEFTGVKNNNYPKPLHKVPEWKREFWALNPGSQDYESRARWGGWHDPGPAYVEANSDTDVDVPGPSSGPRKKQTARRGMPFHHYG
ncbi:hypothetical protein AURDEDRAFT_186972 [Auricularia subglabra TFB-10046 SS5]|nr:hypothetical protein AURDEDRAFT_186972 [Auricularia subglabra TFB-10046 SS5]